MILEKIKSWIDKSKYSASIYIVLTVALICLMVAAPIWLFTSYLDNKLSIFGLFNMFAMLYLLAGAPSLVIAALKITAPKMEKTLWISCAFYYGGLILSFVLQGFIGSTAIACLIGFIVSGIICRFYVRKKSAK